MIKVIKTDEGERITIMTDMDAATWSYLQKSLNNVTIDMLLGRFSEKGKEGLAFLVEVVNQSIPDEQQYLEGIQKDVPSSDR